MRPLTLVHDSSLLTCEPPSWAGWTCSHGWLSSLQVQPCQWFFPPHSKPCSPSFISSQPSDQHLHAARGAGPAPALAKKDVSLLLPEAIHVCNLFPSSYLLLHSTFFSLAVKSFSGCPGVSTLFFAHALTCNLNASAQRWYQWPRCVSVNTHLPTATQGDPNGVHQAPGESTELWLTGCQGCRHVQVSNVPHAYAIILAN